MIVSDRTSGGFKMAKVVKKRYAALALGVALAIMPAIAAHAGIAYTGARYCGTLQTAQTIGWVQPYNTIKHFQLVGGQWWASPTLFHEGSSSLRTTWWYSYSTRFFTDSQIQSNLSTPSPATTGCFN